MDGLWRDFREEWEHGSGFAVSSLWSPSWVPAIANGNCGFGWSRGFPCSYWGWSIAWNTPIWSSWRPKIGIPRHRCSTVIGKYWHSTISCWTNSYKKCDRINRDTVISVTAVTLVASLSRHLSKATYSMPTVGTNRSGISVNLISEIEPATFVSRSDSKP